jgi:acyl-coenzyme A synthetase/AMP-(fatty) acid ligase
MSLATSFDYIELHARQIPGQIAITGPAGEIDWARFRADAETFIQALGRLGLEPGRILVISHADTYIHWLLMIGCEALGLVSASVTPEDTDTTQLLDLADLVLTEDRIAGLLAEGGKAEGEGLKVMSPADSETPLRIVRTSGSTGTPKCILLTRRMQNHWIGTINSLNFRGARPRYYAAYPLSVNPNLYRMEACLRLGGTVILGRASQDLVTYEASHCWLLPRDMATLLQGVQGRWPSPHPLHMNLGGGPVSAALHDATESLFGTEVQLLYGINEAGRIGLVDRDGIVTLLPEVDFKILDESGRALSEGETGRIVVRTSGIAAGYLNDPEASAEHFRQGWFFTDDIGTLLPNGRFRIQGRRSEIVNLGGFKLMLGAVEEALRAHVAGIREIAVTTVPNAQDIEELCVAVVPDGSASQSALFAAVQGMLPATYGKFWLLCLEKLPVGASGKVQRSALKDVFAAANPPRS